MTENTLLYTYTTKVCERWDLTADELKVCLLQEIENANIKNYNLILTGKGHKNISFFDAYTAPKLTKNFLWLHFCPQDILSFDGDAGKYYILTFTGYAKDGLFL